MPWTLSNYPAEIGLANLEHMDFGSNVLSSPIPPEFGNLADPYCMWPHHNRLSSDVQAE